MPRLETTGEYLLLWIDPRAGIATGAVKANRGGWLLRYYDGANHTVAWNLSLPEIAGPTLLAEWATQVLCQPVTATLRSQPRRWVPYRFRDCGEGTSYSIAPAASRKDGHAPR
jgi:hypothetical protein